MSGLRSDTSNPGALAGRKFLEIAAELHAQLEGEDPEAPRRPQQRNRHAAARVLRI